MGFVRGARCVYARTTRRLHTVVCEPRKRSGKSRYKRGRTNETETQLNGAGHTRVEADVEYKVIDRNRELRETQDDLVDGFKAAVFGRTLRVARDLLVPGDCRCGNPEHADAPENQILPCSDAANLVPLLRSFEAATAEHDAHCREVDAQLKADRLPTSGIGVGWIGGRPRVMRAVDGEVIADTMSELKIAARECVAHADTLRLFIGKGLADLDSDKHKLVRHEARKAAKRMAELALLGADDQARKDLDGIAASVEDMLATSDHWGKKSEEVRAEIVQQIRKTPRGASLEFDAPENPHSDVLAEAMRIKAEVESTLKTLDFFVEMTGASERARCTRIEKAMADAREKFAALKLRVAGGDNATLIARERAIEAMAAQYLCKPGEKKEAPKPKATPAPTKPKQGNLMEFDN